MRNGTLTALQETVSTSIVRVWLLQHKLEIVMFVQPAHNRPIFNVNTVLIHLELFLLLEGPLFIPSPFNFHLSVHNPLSPFQLHHISVYSGVFFLVPLSIFKFVGKIALSVVKASSCSSVRPSTLKYSPRNPLFSTKLIGNYFSHMCRENSYLLTSGKETVTLRTYLCKFCIVHR